MKIANRITERRGGIAVGVLVTIAACGAQYAGWLGRLDDFGFKLHFQYVGGIQADPRIVLVDIDDQSLAAIGEWPWHRRHYADLVNTLHDLGAEAIVLDVILAEPTAPRVEHAGLGRDYDLDPQTREFGNRTSDPPIYDDDELRDAIRYAGVFLPMYATLGRPGRSGERARVQARIAALLERDFTLDETQIAMALGQSDERKREFVRENFVAAKRLAARNAARRYSRDSSASSWREFAAAAMPDRDPDAPSADRKWLVDAFRAERSRGMVSRMAWGASGRLKGPVPLASDPVFPLDKFTEAAAGVGFVAFDRKESGGVLRSVPIVVDVGGSLIPQLGLLVGAKWMKVDASLLELDEGMLVVGGGDQPLRIPMDDEGQTLINWHAVDGADGSRDWRSSFIHLPAAAVLELSSNRRALDENEKRVTLARFELLQTRHAETPAEFARYVALIHKRDEILNSAERARDARATESLPSELAIVEQSILEMESEAMVWLQRAENLWRNEQPRDESEASERNRILRLYGWLHDNQLVSRVADIRRTLETRNAQLRKEFSTKIGGKLCLIGYTASGVADLVTTPVHAEVPGVVAHANIINMVLQHKFIRRASARANIFLMMLAGLAATMAACGAGWRTSLAGLLLLGAFVVLFGAVVFRAGSVHVAALPAVACLGIVWGGVTLYRQSTEERIRRRLQNALVQYTSAAVASRVVERFDRAMLAPQTATVTCFFSDLSGFTQLSERLGPARTRQVLNPYLESVSRILLDHKAIVNKFIGDGVFAFFNSPILECSDHARAGCAAAWASREAVRQLNETLARALGGVPLVARIGVSTGDAFVGDYGSEMKLDYTCIGDTVNLGSRLEQLNKSLGTSILVDDATRHAGGEGFAFRPVGRVAVPGRSSPATVHELVGFDMPSDAGVIAFRDCMIRAIDHYQSSEWDPCMAALVECRRLRPDDRVVAVYARCVEHFRRDSRPDNWDGALRPDIAGSASG